jgi:lysophospholipase L1-like esterase
MPTDASEVPSQPQPFAYPLTNLAARLRLAERPPVKIVALGSSTTAGEGNIVAYPYRLEALLRAKYAPQDRPHPMIDVLNRGIGGEEAPAEFQRLQQDVVIEQPSLVIWQFGTNSVWQPPDQHPPSLAKTIGAVRGGIALLRQACGADIILMDPQYTPAMLTPEKIAATNAMVDAIARLADELNVNLFRRFASMRRWHEVENVPLALLVDPTDSGQLHDSDWTTQLLTQLLMDQIADAVARANELAS